MNQRHQLIYLKKQPKFELTSAHQHPEMIYQALDSWLDARLPCVYTRQPCQNTSLVHLGLTVFIDQQRYRAGLVIDPAMIERVSTLPTLSECGEFFPDIQQVCDLESIHVYGSFLFQYLSKNAMPSFVNNDSDLDLLMDYKQTSLHAMAQNIKALTDATQRRIDGEVRFNGIGDLSINELTNTLSEQLLVKTSINTFLISRNKLYEDYPSLLG